MCVARPGVRVWRHGLAFEVVVIENLVLLARTLCAAANSMECVIARFQRRLASMYASGKTI